MKKIISWLALASLSSATIHCGSTTVTSHPLPSHELSRLQWQIHGRKATVRAEHEAFAGHPSNRVDTFSGRTYLESATLRVVSSAGEQRLALAHVQEIDADHSGLGFLLGLVAGPLVGAGLGWLVAKSIASDGKEYGGLEYIPVFTLGVGGLVAGGVIGARVMSGPTWRFTPAAR
jgi:hypothetical protein